MQNIVDIGSLITQGKILKTADIDPANDYAILQKWRAGNRKRGAGIEAYESFAIPLSELLGGGSVYFGDGTTITLGPGNIFSFTSMNISQFTNDSGYLTATTVVNTAWALNGNTVGSEKFLGTIDNFALPIIINNVERARFTTAGDLGIGINNPGGKLHVYSSATNYAVFGNNQPAIYMNADNYIQLNPSGIGGVTISANSTGVILRETGGNLYSFTVDDTAVGAKQALTFSDFLYKGYSVAGLNYFEVNHGGVFGANRLGVNVTPTATAHFKGIDATSANYALKVENSASAPLLHIKNNGEVLINTLTPLPNFARLSVDGNVGTTGSYNTFTAGGDPFGVLRFNNVAGTTQYFAAGYDTFGAFLQSYGNSLILNHLANNVGIGLTNPTARLHLKDSIDGIATGNPNAIFETSTGGVLFESKSIDGFQMKFTEGVTNRGSFTNAGGYAQLISQFRFTLKDYANVSKLWMDSTNGYIGIGDAYFAAGTQLDVRTTGAFTNAIDASTVGGYAVHGTANTGVGVRGVNNASYGIGVDGFSLNNLGVRGLSTNGVGGYFSAPLSLLAKGIDATAANWAFRARDIADVELFYVRNDGAVSTKYGIWIDGIKKMWTDNTFLHTVFWNHTNASALTLGSSRNTLVGNSDSNQPQLTTGAFNSVFGTFSGMNITTGNRNLVLANYDMLTPGSGSRNINMGQGGMSNGAADETLTVNGFSENSNEAVFGSEVYARYSNWWFGQGKELNNASGRFNMNWNATSSKTGQTDSAAMITEWVFAASRGTGTGTGGDFVWKVAPAGATGSTLNPLVVALRVRQTGGIAAPLLQTGNAGLVTGDLYVDTAANILANGDVVVGRKV